MNRTPLNAAHRAANAKLVDFAGWEMPVLYTSIVEEHQHTRTAAGMFDVSHMGRLDFTGPDAMAVLQRGLTRNLSKLAVGRCGYAHICNERGGVIDDVIVSHDAERWQVVCNASNRPKVVAHFGELLRGRNAKLIDRSAETCMIALQGPAAMSLLQGGLPVQVPAAAATMKRYSFVTGSAFGISYGLYRTGYTGEDGFELVAPAAAAPMIWDFLLKSASRGGPDVRPVGLGARDTLRLEAGMCLYGHELNEEIDPISAGCQWCCDLACDFVGANALRRIAETGPPRRLVGLTLEGRRIARQGAAVLAGETVVGQTTSGTFGPTVGKSIAMAYVDAAHAKEGASLSVDLGNAKSAATIVPLPFFKRA